MEKNCADINEISRQRSFFLDLWKSVITYAKETKKFQKNIINKTAGNQRLTGVCGKEDAY